MIHPRAISVSRRCDIPAFYADWFMQRLAAGRVGWVNPYGGRRQLVSLAPADVAAFVFWSRDYRPFGAALDAVEAAGIPYICHWTITGYPPWLDTYGPDPADAVAAFRALAARIGAGRLTWRYDPLVFAGDLDAAWHRANFARLADALSGAATACTISFATRYRKVEAAYRALAAAGHAVREAPPAERIALAAELSALAAARGMTLAACCCPDLAGAGEPPVGRAACIDGPRLAALFPAASIDRRARPTRDGCGCTAATDIGAYDSCAHGCAYCYATRSPEAGRAAVAAHDPAAPFLGVDRATGEVWEAELLAAAKERAQPGLFGASN